MKTILTAFSVCATGLFVLTAAGLLAIYRVGKDMKNPLLYGN